MEFTQKMAHRLRKLYSANVMDVGDFIEDSGLPDYIINRYFFYGEYNTIEREHLCGLARAFYMSPDELYAQLKGDKPLKGRFGSPLWEDD